MRIYSSEFRVDDWFQFLDMSYCDLWSRVWGLAFRVEGSGCRVRVQGVGLRHWGYGIMVRI